MNFPIGEDKIIAIDLETTGLCWWRHKAFLVSYASSKGNEAYPITSEIIEELRVILADPTIKKVGHNIKFDLAFLRNFGITYWTNIHDTALIYHLINDKGEVALKSLSKTQLRASAGDNQAELKDFMRKHKLQTYDQVPVDILYPYAKMDAQLTYELFIKASKTNFFNSFDRLYTKEMQLVDRLMKIEQRGMLVDKGKWEELKEQYSFNRVKAMETCMETLGVINLNSDEELAEALQKSCGIKITEKGKNGKPLTNKMILQRNDHPIIAQILKFREYDKISSIYFSDKFIDMLDGDVLHPTFNQVRTRTGRLACSEPNLQNVPKDALLREIFKAREEFIGFDFNQLELRIFGYYTKSVDLKKMFEEDKDFHDETAKLMGVERATAKNINFGILYGMGVDGFTKRHGGIKEEVDKLFKRYYATFPMIRGLRNKVYETIQSSGCIRTVYGRILHHTPDEAYKGLNSLIQSTAGDMAKFSLLNEVVSLAIEKGWVINHVHDEVLIDKALPDSAIKEICEGLEKWVYPMRVTVTRYNQCWRKEK